jgi:N-dimethylarginine dimethylaminohydrolase
VDASKNKAQHPFTGEHGARRLSRALLCRPDFYCVNEPRNPFTRPGEMVDSARAIKQWEALCAALEHAGLEVSVAEPAAGLEDMCFTASQFFAGIDLEERSFAVPARMLHRTRRDEVQRMAQWYSAQGYRILDLDLGGEDFLEGSADLLWSPELESIWAGYGNRSTLGAVQQFAAVMESLEFSVRPLEMVDPHFYHLNLCMAPLTPDSVLLYSGAFSPEALAEIRRHVRTHEVSREDALHFVCNGLTVNGYYITPRVTRLLEQALGSEGIVPLPVDLSEFQKAGGSAASLAMLLP